MIAKELNQALSDDKLREQWLKRILPALVVTVIYFVFVSNVLTEKTGKAEQAYKALVMKGISEMALPGMNQQNASLDEALLKLQEQDQVLQASLAEKASFLFGKNDINETVERIADVLLRHGLKISQEQAMNDKKVADLSKSAADLKYWLTDSLKTDEPVRLYRVIFLGGYVDVYEALRELATSNIKALPVFLTMKDPEKTPDAYPGMKAWVLDLWI